MGFSGWFSVIQLEHFYLLSVVFSEEQMPLMAPVIQLHGLENVSEFCVRGLVRSLLF